jgi:transposase
MDEREQQRKIRHRLAVLRHAEEVSGNVSATCRYYGISRQCFYKWTRRYDELGEEGLRDGSSRPLRSPNATDPEIIAKVIFLRRSYHFGPGRISMYLARYHDVSISPSGVWRILKRLGLNRLPASQRYKRQERRWRRYEKPMPGPPDPGRRQVHRADRAEASQVLPVHRDRRLHEVASVADLRPQQPDDRDPVPRLRALQAAIPGRVCADRQRR